jgi:hypothetical protein
MNNSKVRDSWLSAISQARGKASTEFSDYSQDCMLLRHALVRFYCHELGSTLAAFSAITGYDARRMSSITVSDDQMIILLADACYGRRRSSLCMPRFFVDENFGKLNNLVRVVNVSHFFETRRRLRGDDDDTVAIIDIDGQEYYRIGKPWARPTLVLCEDVTEIADCLNCVLSLYYRSSFPSVLHIKLDGSSYPLPDGAALLRSLLRMVDHELQQGLGSRMTYAEARVLYESLRAATYQVCLGSVHFYLTFGTIGAMVGGIVGAVISVHEGATGQGQSIDATVGAVGGALAGILTVGLTEFTVSQISLHSWPCRLVAYCSRKLHRKNEVIDEENRRITEPPQTLNMTGM